MSVLCVFVSVVCLRPAAPLGGAAGACLEWCPATGTAFAGAVLYCVSFGHTVTTSLGGKCYDWFLWNADVGM